MKKIISLVIGLVLLGCGEEPIGNWGYEPSESVLIWELGEDCYTQNQCLVEIYRDCENLCSTIYFYQYFDFYMNL